MSGAQWVGVAMVALPMLGIFGWTIAMDGWDALSAWAIAVALTAMIVVGLMLAFGGAR